MREELMSLFPPVPEVTRRTFVVTSLSAGFALAVQPVQEQTKITTDTNGLTAGEVKIPVKDGDIPAYRAMPDKGKNFPVVLVVQEIFGVHEHIKDICRRFAKAGYLAVAPEMYARQGDVSKLTAINDIIPIVNKVPDAQVMSDLDAAVEWAKKNNGNTNKLAVTGFCWGGRIVWLYAAHNPKLKAGVAWYGRLRPAAGPCEPATAQTPARDRERFESPRARSLRRRGSGNSEQHGRTDAECAERDEKAFGDQAISRHAARLLCRLSEQLPQRAGDRRLESPARMVQEEWRRMRTAECGMRNAECGM